MIARRRRFFRGDSLLDMPFFSRSCNPVQFARVFQSATGIIVFAQLAIATSTGSEKLMSMWKVHRSSLAKHKFTWPFASLQLHLIFVLGMAICPQSHGGQANVAYFAGGCFWCTEAVFEEAPGVTSVISGYMQGAETVQVTFDPARTSYDKLLILFWEAHDPTQVDRQGGDVGKQ